MHIIRDVHDQESWRDVARALLAEHVHPERVLWRDVRDSQDSLFGQHVLSQLDPVSTAVRDELHSNVHTGLHLVAPNADVRVPRHFLEMIECVACHADPQRWDALYRVLYRLTHGEPALLAVATDPEVHRLLVMQKQVRRDVHKMHAFVRFRSVETEIGSAYIAWFEPHHYIVERAVQLFVRRFASMKWSVLTPKGTAHWDGQSLTFGAGVAREGLPMGDALETLWRTYYAHIFNPARVAVNAMRAEMPMRYWRNLPEASLIATLTREAPSRMQRMLEQFASPAEPLPKEMAAAQDVHGRSCLPNRCAVRATDTTDTTDTADRVVSPSLASAGYDPVHDAGSAAARARSEHTRAAWRSAAAPAALCLRGVPVKIGTASWTDPTILQRGVFYPDHIVNAEQRLRYYASRHSLVEVDSTYYVPPVRSAATAWAQRTPESFVFHVKAYALMTGHAAEVKRMPDWLRRQLPRSLMQQSRVGSNQLSTAILDDVWQRFIGALQPLEQANKLGPILLQFPRWFTPSRQSADILRAARARLGEMPAAVEFRNPEWVSGRLLSRTLALLEQLQLTYVIVDAPPGTSSSMPPIRPITTPSLAVVRLHGRRQSTWEARNPVVSERYRYLYSASELREWSHRIDDLGERMHSSVIEFPDMAKAQQGVHIVFNNCHANYGTSNADEITGLLIELDKERRRTSTSTESQVPATGASGDLYLANTQAEPVS